MTRIFATAGSIVSPLGMTADETFESMWEGISGLRKTEYPWLNEQTYISALSDGQWTRLSSESQTYNTGNRFEQLLLKPSVDAIQSSGVITSDEGVIFIAATTKGDINSLGILPYDNLHLHYSVGNVSRILGFVNTPVVVSNACISGLSAIIVAMRLLKSGRYHTAVVAGADVLGRFIISGFDSLFAMSPEMCRPFDKERKGINLGEGGAAVVLRVKKYPDTGDTELLGAAITNDANHVSAPSRTGEELAMAIEMAFAEASVKPEDVNFVSAHGTATLYNDEMEAKALSLAKVAHLPTHSLKGYIGHTLGAAGLIETIICFRSLLEGKFIASKGFDEQGTTIPVNICNNRFRINQGAGLKTMAGFGGCNAALIFASNS